MGSRVTLQEIADALGISRNTVSRALNNNGTVSAETRKKICQTAIEMGYKQFQQTSPVPANNTDGYELPSDKTEIALFTNAFPGSSHSATKLLETFQYKVNSFGFKLSINIIRENEIANLCLPANLNTDGLAGIICIELFSKEYADFLCKQDIPLLFVDTHVTNHGTWNADLLYMENISSVYNMLDSLVNAGHTNISFIGDRFHCQSFYERWQAYVSVLADHNLKLELNKCILDDDSNPYADINWLCDRLGTIEKLPDVFFCANDFLAVTTMKALQKLGKNVPSDIRICGFDDAPEATLVEPNLTTIRIHSSSMGYTAADLLLSRIANPNMPYRKTYIRTDVIFRDSTK
jgi:LacI family transcriptional regulator